MNEKKAPNGEHRSDVKEPYDKGALKEISQQLREQETVLQPYTDIAATLRQSFDFAQRAVRQFTALDTMIIVTCGMLKAGKSTLINLLARSDMASPVDFGVDTTLRPAVVRMGEAEQGRIRSFYAQGGKEEHKATLLQVFDVLRGVALVKPAAFDEESVPLTPQNLRDFLCCNVPSGLLKREPLLVVVETPYQADLPCLLNGNCMLLDMPGLDSANAALSIDEYADVVAQCDMMFYVQSSVSPLNERAKELLQLVLSHRHADTTYIIQNCMMAQMWRLSETQRAAQERQAQRARADIVTCFKSGGKQASADGVRCHPMNLGMAYDALVGDKSVLNTAGVMPDGRAITAKLLAELSDFPGFEDDVRRNMRLYGLRYRVQHCVDGLAGCLEEIRHKLNRHIVGTLQPAAAEADADWKAWSRVKQELEHLQNNAVLTSPATGASLSEAAENRLKNALESVHEHLYQEKEELYRPLKNLGGKARGSVMDQFLEDCRDEMVKKTEEFVNTCSLDDVMLAPGKSLLSFVNAALHDTVFRLCEASSKTGDETLPLYKDIQTYARAEYTYQHAQTLGGEYKKKQFERLPLSDRGGKGYPFTQYKEVFGSTVFNMLGERKSLVVLAHKVREQLVKDYLAAVGDYVAAHAQDLQRTLFENGKKRGLQRSIAFVKKQEDRALKERERLKQQMACLNSCIAAILTLEQKTKEIR